MSGPLHGKVALVTGASRGIGRASALALGRDGATVIVNYVSNAVLAEEVVKEIGSDRSIAIQADVSDLTAGRAMIDQIVEKYGKVDILCLNAGLLAQNGSLDDTTEEAFDMIYKTNVKAPFFMLKHAAKHIPEGGRVLLFSTSLTSLSAITPNYLLYTSTKGAIEQMTRILAKDLGRRGITVNAIAPGPTGTEAFYKGKPDQLVKTIASWNPQGRIGKPEEIADIVTMVARQDSQWLNGQILRINGGMTVG